MNHVFLIGFMGAGKSTVGPILADLLGIDFVDLDDRIVAEQGRSVAEIFEHDGEPHFRNLEREAIESVAADSPAVIACGGGIVTAEGMSSRLRELGTVVYLETTAEETLERIPDTSSRPLLREPEQAEALFQARVGLYAQAADIIVDTVGRTPEAIAEEIGDRIRESSRSGKPSVVPVSTASGSYEIVIGPGVLDDVGQLVRMVAPGANNVAMVTDSNVADLFGINVERKLIEASYRVHPLTVAAGEESKSWATAGEVLEALAELQLDRRDVIVALGGGVIGDLAGFAAATYLRGVEFVQVPTTLLAQVDSSVGGKTGVDLRAGKNLAGAFKQPLIVIADTSVLGLLPDAEWASGLAEIAKSAVVEGGAFLSWIEANATGLRDRRADLVIEAVRRSVRFKSRVVSADETEAGPRECLNYGHTLGHALEKVLGYGVLPHGLAVAEGMRFASRLSVDAGHGSVDFVRRQDDLLDALGLPALAESADPRALVEAMHSDKKARGGSVRFVLVHSAGEWSCDPVSEQLIGEHLSAWARSKGGGPA